MARTAAAKTAPVKPVKKITAPRARRTSSGCECRVPLDELRGVSRESLEYYADKGVEVDTDYRGRLSIPVADAKRLFEEENEVAVRAWEEQNALRNAVDQAQKDRDKRLNDAMTRLIRTPGVDIETLQRQAIREALEPENDLPDEIRQQLTLPMFIPYSIGG